MPPLSIKVPSAVRRSALLSIGCGLACPTGLVLALSRTVEGIALPDSAVVDGQRLQLNGAALRRRGYYKSCVVGLYLPDRLTTVETVARLDRPRRIHVHMLRNFSSSTISRMLISDIEKNATPAEFKQLIDVVAQIGGMYAEIKSVEDGDLSTIDWIPGTGIVSRYNNRLLGNGPIHSELAFQIYLRMFLGRHVTAEFRNALLGLAPQT